eukprot:CAMPEP_0206217656 /NCGR_PEP_ID=MMETSP0047_2-20121206/3389_1 /ASSEMBLY_ACC=CAM_ASM_000192 /TAXON_ID=195065 /ORGANISM="Chroomonas mesostigmatica_cf, Strain CCMP1168" /LENGTH=34 /DNA_ID= /DNA_START= /DNA_END= /DNA_ORIENTATION=
MALALRHPPVYAIDRRALVLRRQVDLRHGRAGGL